MGFFVTAREAKGMASKEVAKLRGIGQALEEQEARVQARSKGLVKRCHYRFIQTLRKRTGDPMSCNPMGPKFTLAS